MKNVIQIKESQLAIITQHINEGSEIGAYLDAFDTFVRDTGICSLNEDEILSEDILSALTTTLKKGILITSAAVALGLVTPQEAQAQFKAKPNREYVKIFGDRAKKQCSQVGKQKKLNTNSPKPAKRLLIYQYNTPKVDSGDMVYHNTSNSNFDSDSGKTYNFVKDKTGEFKEIDDTQLSKFMKKYNVSVKTMSHNDAKSALVNK